VFACSSLLYCVSHCCCSRGGARAVPCFDTRCVLEPVSRTCLSLWHVSV
jgi:hypothetical protein